ncbi:MULTISPECIES: hypothetical protein [unclassified Microcoleus]|uniref:hypothetical protein n=1 Tax=unclassified Microcoleus TaxID=2642155 RepID=UPI002FCF24C7
MPVPQRVNFLVEQASRTGKMPVPQRVNFLVEQAEKPVHKKLIENVQHLRSNRVALVVSH